MGATVDEARVRMAVRSQVGLILGEQTRPDREHVRSLVAGGDPRGKDAGEH